MGKQYLGKESFLFTSICFVTCNHMNQDDWHLIGKHILFQLVFFLEIFTCKENKRISTTLQHHFKKCFLCFFHEKQCFFYTYLFCCNKMKWLFISSNAIWVTGSDAGSVASRTRSQLTRSTCEWTRIWTI